jgi:hypothetical protein
LRPQGAKFRLDTAGGACLGHLGPRHLRAQRRSCLLRGRHGRRASREEGLWQGMPSRCSSFDTLPHDISLGTQVGRVVHPCPVAVLDSPLGPAGVGGALPSQGVEQNRRGKCLALVSRFYPDANLYAHAGGAAVFAVAPARAERRRRLVGQARSKRTARSSRFASAGTSGFRSRRDRSWKRTGSTLARWCTTVRTTPLRE